MNFLFKLTANIFQSYFTQLVDFNEIKYLWNFCKFFLLLRPNGVYEKRKTEVVLDKKNFKKWLSEHQFDVIRILLE